MGLLTTECLDQETVIDRRAPWTADELDHLVAGLLREPPPEGADPLPCAEPLECCACLPAPRPVEQAQTLAPDRWFGLELWMLWALVTHER